MDGRLQAILGDENALRRIAAAVRGEPTEKEAPTESVASTSSPSTLGTSNDAAALLAALRPFLKDSRREKLDRFSKAITVASVYRNAKSI